MVECGWGMGWEGRGAGGLAGVGRGRLQKGGGRGEGVLAVAGGFSPTARVCWGVGSCSEALCA